MNTNPPITWQKGNLTAMKAAMRQVQSQARTIMDTKSLTTQQKAAQLDQLKATRTALDEELRVAEKSSHLGQLLAGNYSTTQDFKNYAAMYPEDAKNFTFGQKTAGLKGQAPQIVPDLDQLADLHDALLSHKSFRAQVKSTGPIDAANQVGVSGMLPPTLVGMVAPAHEPVRLMSLFPSAATESPLVEYLRHTSTTGTAQTVGVGGLKPTVVPHFDTVEARARKIAALMTVPDEDLADYGNFLTYLTMELQRIVIDTENDQILNGDGTGENLLGILHQPGLLTLAVDTSSGATALDTVEEAMTDLRVGPAHCEPDLIVMNPTTWSKVRRTKDSQGRYLAGDPLESDVSALWGVPVAVTTTMAAGTALVCDSNQLAMTFVRMGITVESDYGSDGFEHNTTRVRAEERFALACPRPTAGIEVTGL